MLVCTMGCGSLLLSLCADMRSAVGVHHIRRPSSDAELPLEEGQLIMLLVCAKHDPWWYGWKDSGDPGWFPSSHITSFTFVSSEDASMADADEDEQLKSVAKKKKRDNIATELLQTEIGYNKDLHTIVDGYLEPCRLRVKSAVGNNDLTHDDIVNAPSTERVVHERVLRGHGPRDRRHGTARHMHPTLVCLIC